MKTKVNSPWFSKINWSSALQAAIGMFILWELTPEQYNDKLAGSALLVGGFVNMIFRTFYTTNVTHSYDESDEQ